MAAAGRWRLVLRGAAARARAHTLAPAEAAARYPPVEASLTADSRAARLRRVRRWQAAVRAAPSADEKLRMLTKLQFPKYVVYPQTFALHADRWYQAFTKTAFVPGLPPRAEPAEQPDLDALRAAARRCLAHARPGLVHARPEIRLAAAGDALHQLVSTLVGLLGAANPVLFAAALDYKRPVHFYWLRGEEIIPAGHRKGRVDALRYQINDRPHNQLRIPKQLPEFVPLDYSVPVEIPVMKCKPDKLPLFKRQYENTIFTGSKTADPCCYGHTQFHLLPHRLQREKLVQRNCADQIEVVNRANAIASLFAWTGAQAMYQGFWSEADLTRPFVSQGVVTDGKYFSFFCYQLNTLALTAEADQNNPRKNLCWGTESKPLYETVEDDDVKGFNDEVLLQLAHFLLNKPKEEQPQRREIQESI